MANWTLPTVSSLRADVLAILKERDDELAKMFDGTSPTNLPTGAIRWNSTALNWEKWNGTAWAALNASDYAISVNSVQGRVPAAAATANTLALRDAGGRMKAAAPVATDDVLRLAEMNTHKAAATLDHPDSSVTTIKIANLAVTSGKLAAGAAVANIGYTPVNKAGDAMTGGLGLIKGTDVASAATLNPGATGNFFNVTGTTTITAISTTARSPLYLKFAGALSITNGASLVLPGSLSIVTAANDIAEFFLDGTIWRCTNYFRADGNVVVSGSSISFAGSTGVLNQKMGATIASASTVNLDTATGDTVGISGTTQILNITLSEGRVRRMLFTGSLVLSNAGNIQMPVFHSTENITTKSGDVAVVLGLSGGLVRIVDYQTANGLPLAPVSIVRVSQVFPETSSSIFLSVPSSDGMAFDKVRFSITEFGSSVGSFVLAMRWDGDATANNDWVQVVTTSAGQTRYTGTSQNAIPLTATAGAGDLVRVHAVNTDPSHGVAEIEMNRMALGRVLFKARAEYRGATNAIVSVETTGVFRYNLITNGFPFNGLNILGRTNWASGLGATAVNFNAKSKTWLENNYA